MRITLLFTTGVLAVAVGLAACSGGSQALPGGSQAVAPMAHSALHLSAVSTLRDLSCPYSDFACVTVNSSSGGSISICVCGGPSVTWSGAFYTKKGALFHKFVGSFDPNPGNPMTVTITERKPVKSSNGNYNGKYKWYEAIMACPESGSCYSGNLGIATD